MSCRVGLDLGLGLDLDLWLSLASPFLALIFVLEETLTRPMEQPLRSFGTKCILLSFLE
jgi:hypothetical protein